jgi:4-diphosphocytidyl-2-C-methyl-D-erythritol kinase
LAFGAGDGAKITLTKNLPVASGIGGGSADAAATLRALSRLWAAPIPPSETLGADVPVCLGGRPTRMQGIGDILMPIPDLPAMAILLANPGIPIATADVFRRLEWTNGSDLPQMAWTDAASFVHWLSTCRNDLQQAAEALCQPIASLIAEISALDGCLLARMSGSGATCFGLFAGLAEAKSAATVLKKIRPDYWGQAAEILP